MNKREFITSALAINLYGWSNFIFADEFKFKRERYGYPNYPTWTKSANAYQDWQTDSFKVSSYSGGYEKSFPFNILENKSIKIELEESLSNDLKYGGFFKSNLNDYFFRKPATSILVVKNNKLIYEKYGFDRNKDMRLFSWSMAKSVTGILLGICIDKKFIEAYDDIASKYVPSLDNTYHGSITLRNLSNMSSGAKVLTPGKPIPDEDNRFIYRNCLFGFDYVDTNISRVIRDWNKTSEEQGKLYNYNELCPLTIGMVIREATGKSLSEFASEHLWTPLGCTSDATWLTDSKKAEVNSIGIGATARDWCKLGMLISNKGKMNDIQILSESWVKEMTTWSDKDNQVKFGKVYMGKDANHAYKCFMWHFRKDGSLPCFQGFDGQKIFIDLKTNTVLVHTSVGNEYEFEYPNELIQILESAGKLNI
jgi:CubicO group peptidase (beta-lactamase class C family)